MENKLKKCRNYCWIEADAKAKAEVGLAVVDLLFVFCIHLLGIKRKLFKSKMKKEKLNERIWMIEDQLYLETDDVAWI